MGVHITGKTKVSKLVGIMAKYRLVTQGTCPGALTSRGPPLILLITFARELGGPKRLEPALSVCTVYVYACVFVCYLNMRAALGHIFSVSC